MKKHKIIQDNKLCFIALWDTHINHNKLILNYPPVYIDKSVDKVIRLHQSIIDQRLAYNSVYNELNAYANNLYDNFRLGIPTTTIEISNYHPDYIGAKSSTILNSEIELEDFQLVIAKEYGFNNWEMVKGMKNTPIDRLFETCVDDLLSGNLGRIKSYSR